ncbi:WD40 repeat [Saccharopolyspora antimicrobica]|uniref:WD40 repeat n=1 Tax=Saccharopolyspora antimicrobica TaxID=455193 RepID=A0A1I4TZ93_9PSEU|nr:TIR domain-containing protein [Saccharopolyspora antimicrobica]RKT88600.1 WD40 repeat protein [Saccharopolyspora antimicrobica]SFM81939.1 WD40 repeat [Saccharopolyspora antimicrobica]
MDESGIRYDAFLSYSHAADRRIAPVLRQGLHQLARRWNQVRALRVFQDKESLAANPDLWDTIDNALRESRFFILLASPEAAASPWVGREVEYWRQQRDQGTFLIALTGGEIVWDEAAGDFDWARTTALPESLRGWFSTEPLWVDLSWARDEPELSLRHSRFRFDVATLAAAVHGTAKEELDSEDVRRYRLATLVRRAVAAALTVLLITVLGLGVRTILLQQQTIEQGQQALSRAVAAKSELMGDSDPELSRLLALAAWRVGGTAEAEAAMSQAAARPGIGRIVSGGSVEAVAFSPDGKILVTGGEEVRVWDAVTRRQVGEIFTGQGGPVRTVRFSPDGETLLTAGQGVPAQLWDIKTGRPSGEPYPKDVSAPWDLIGSITAAFSPDGASLVLGDAGHGVTLWDIASHTAMHTLATPQVDPFRRNMVSASVAFHPSGSSFAALGTDGAVRFWDTATGAQVGEPLPAHPGDNASIVGPVLVFSPDGTLFATGGTDGTIRFWDSTTRRPVGAPITGHTRPDRTNLAQSLAFSPDGRMFAAGSEDGMVRLWDVRTRNLLGTPLSGHTRAVTSLAFSPDGRTLASGAQDGTARLWNVAEHLQLAHPAIEHSGMLYALAFSPDGKTLVTGGDNGETASDHGSMEVCSHDGWDVCYIDHGQATVTGSGMTVLFYRPLDAQPPLPGPPRTLMLWDVAQREAVTDLPTRHRTPVLAVAFSPDGATVAASGMNNGEGGTTLWDHANRTPLAQPLSDELSAVRATAFSPDGGVLVTAGMKAGQEPTALMFWDAKSHELLGAFDAGDIVYAVAFSPDGSILATGNAQGEVRFWDTDTRQPIGEALKGHTGPVGTLAFSPDGTQLASAGDDGAIRLWDVASRRLTGDPLVGHTGAVYSLAFHPDGRTLASGGGDSSVRLWNVLARKQISADHLGHRQPVRAIAFSPDGETVASAGEDAAIRFWDVRAAEDVPAALCETARRTLTPEEWNRHLPGADYLDVCPAR